MGVHAADGPELVSFPDDLWSEDSSFYGDDQTKAIHENELKTYNPREFWDVREWNLQYLNESEHAQANEDPRSVKRKRDDHPSPRSVRTKQALVKVKEESNDVKEPEPETLPLARREPHNPYADMKAAKQRNETVNDFLDRLRPSTTAIESGPWIWVANPYSSSRSSDIGGFKQEGYALLEEFVRRREKLQDQLSDKPPASVTRKLKPDREWLERSLLELAEDKKVVHGKWMLFPTIDYVDFVWSKVVTATVDGKLGSASKVATGDDSDDKPERLICVYTEDFSNMQDVKRVLKELKRLKLVSGAADGRSIYYKCDAYTYLDIVSTNEYKLKASMYNSKDLFKEMASGR